ncbi:MAG TPA: Uma2 family endonuclease [Longimicrobium sp.]|nr:Uma2 family endonuclease [Longimicrobium sp.]
MSDQPGTPRIPIADPALLKAVERLLHPERFVPGEEDNESSGHGGEAEAEQSSLSTPEQEEGTVPAREHRYEYVTPRAYLVRERAAEDRTEYFDGRLITMSGGTRLHAAIAQNIGAHLYFRLPEGCGVYQADLKVRAAEANAIMYPDVVVLCGEPGYFDRRNDVVTNPTAVFEVLSPSTERHDRTTKAAAYRAIPSLRAYVFVSQVEPRVEVYAREDGGEWSCAVYRQYTNTVPLPWLGCQLTLAEIYKHLFPAAVAWPQIAT